MIFEDRPGSSVANHGEITEPHAPVTSTEKFERHGHRPAVFLIPGAAVESAERALFAAGFETVVLRAASLKRESLRNVFDLLYSAGLLVLIDADALGHDVKHLIEQESLERSILTSGNATQLSAVNYSEKSARARHHYDWCQPRRKANNANRRIY
jgi:hypothetical protein